LKRIVLGPLTRANNSIFVEVVVENKKVTGARCSGMFFRGFESILRGRDPRDAAYLTQRICGICSSAHGTAASYALENAAGVRPPRNGNVLRNLILAADLLQSHIRNFYLYSLPDYVRGPDMHPFIPGYTRDRRLPKKTNESMLDHYFQAVETSRLAHELMTLLGGKAPHSHGLLAGGSTVPPSTDILMDFGSKLKRINDFINNTMIPDAFTLAEAYQDYFEIGRRTPNLLEFGLFPRDENDHARHFPAGAVVDGRIQELDPSAISEHLKYSWFTGDGKPRHPFEGLTKPFREKDGAYSWVKAPRYAGRPMEGGPLARLWIRGDYRKGVSTMDRIVARVLETKMIGRLMEEWVEELQPGEPVFTPFKVPREAEGAGLTGVMRGPLGHWLRIEKGRIVNYEIITPSAWSFSPRDDEGRMGPVEEALTGTPVEDENEPVEIGRVVRAFDVCSSCTTHLIVRDTPVQKTVILL